MARVFMKLADFRVIMESRYDYVVNQCKEYLFDFPADEADFFLSVTEETVDEEIEKSKET